jgi:hypothetical protein
MWCVRIGGGGNEPRVTPLSINDARLSACIFVGSLSIRRPVEILLSRRKEELE